MIVFELGHPNQCRVSQVLWSWFVASDDKWRREWRLIEEEIEKKSDSPQAQDRVMNCYFPMSIHFPSLDQRSRQVCFPPPWPMTLDRGGAALAFGLRSPEIRWAALPVQEESGTTTRVFPLPSPTPLIQITSSAGEEQGSKHEKWKKVSVAQ